MRKSVQVPTFGDARTDGGTPKDTFETNPLMVSMAGAPGVGNGLNDSSGNITIIQREAGFKVREGGGIKITKNNKNLHVLFRRG